MHQYPFEKLQVWHLAIDLSVMIYQITKKFPSDEKFGLTSQIKRSANSVSANLAEGSGRFSNKEKARYFEIAYGSLLETASHLYLAHKLSFLDKESMDTTRPKIEELSNKINALYKRLRSAQ